MFQEISISLICYKTGIVIRFELLEIFFSKVVLKESKRENGIQRIIKYATFSVNIFGKIDLHTEEIF